MSDKIFELLYKKDSCTGCCACYNICAVNAITMKYDKEGFIVPKLNENICVKCKQCITVCPVSHVTNIKTDNKIESILAYANDEKKIHLGSSGGIFPVIATKILKDSGVIFGAAFDDKTKEVKLVSSDYRKMEDIYRSKYVQSYVGDEFRKLKIELDKGRKVLFASTPCQVEALHNFLNKTYENLYTIDFICHGVPSPGVFKKFLEIEEKKEKSKIINCTFREKKHGWRNQYIIVYFENGKTKEIQSKWGIYYNLFIQNYILRQSCYKCNLYKCHKSDLTLADGWESRINDFGISKIYVNSPKGKKLLENIKEEIVVESFIEEIITKYKHNYNDKNRQWFFDKYDQNASNMLLFHACKIKCIKNKLISKLLKK